MRFTSAAVVFVASCLGAASADGTPTPPRQADPWAPPATNLPRFLVSATTALYEQGLADPRGCDYREVRLASDKGPAGDHAAVRPPSLHAWVIPATEDGPKAAVGWDGLVYQVSAVGPPADVEADVRAIVRGAAGEKDRAAGTRPVRPWVNVRRGAGDAASQVVLDPVKVVVLLRLGRADLAESVWAAATGWAADRPRYDLAGYGVSYLSLAGDWAWSLFGRALAAHAAGDDARALADLRELARVAPLIEARAEALGFPRPRDFQDNDRAMPYLGFLGPAPALLADQERRAKEPKRDPEPVKIADRDARVAALIVDFDRVGAEATFFPGGADLGSAPAVKAVVKEGDAAVEPLLTCLERDERFTRTVDYDNRHGTRFVQVQPVRHAAFAALTQILGTHEFGGNSPAAIRAYWKRSRGLAPEERWYQTLADDNATPRQWLDSAEALSQPSDVRGRGGSYSIAYRPAGKVPPARGEPLRGKKDPSVTELIARRVESIDPSGKPLTPGLKNPRGGSGEIFPVLDANRMAGFLARWDPAGSLATLRARVARCRAIISATNGEGSHEQALKTDLARFTMARHQVGDPKALDDYADFVKALPPSRDEVAATEVFGPMWMNPDHPAIAAAAEALFAAPNSPWVPLFRPRQRGWNDGNFADLINSPLLGVAPFRALVLAGLADKAETGTVVTDPAGKIAIGVDEGWTTMPVPPIDDPLRPRPSTTMPLRMADLYCWKLQGLGGTPRLEMYWPLAERDEAVAACAAFLRQYGARFRYNLAAKSLYESVPFYPQHPKAVLAFDPLDRPATPDDVRAGRAVFSLAPAEARRWLMPAYPMRARWTTLVVPADDPVLRMNPPPKGVVTAQVEMLQGGTVWQAEEAREGGRWRRYYGFVGRHALARVPAEEIEFPAEWNTDWRRLSAGLDVRIIPPGGRDDGKRVITQEVPPGGPLWFEIWVRNRRGVEATVPGVRGGTDGGTWLCEGVAVSLFRVPEAPGTLPRRPQSRVGEEVAARPVRRLPRGVPTQALAPADAFRALRLDLRDMFAVDKPGRYRLEVTFDDLKRADGTSAVVSVDYTLTGPTGTAAGGAAR